MKILHGLSDANLAFDDLCGLMRYLRFEERIRGSHHIFSRENVKEIVNLQPLGSKAKTYQVKQIRKIILKYHLGDEDDQVWSNHLLE